MYSFFASYFDADSPMVSLLTFSSQLEYEIQLQLLHETVTEG